MELLKIFEDQDCLSRKVSLEVDITLAASSKIVTLKIDSREKSAAVEVEESDDSLLWRCISRTPAGSLNAGCGVSRITVNRYGRTDSVSD
jgi:hypothetical protein